MRFKIRILAILTLIVLSSYFVTNSILSKESGTIGSFRLTKSLLLEIHPPSWSFLSSLFLKDEDERFYEEELSRLASSPYIYTQEKEVITPQERSLMSSIKRISWFPVESTPETYDHCRYSNCKHAKDMIATDLVVFDPVGMLQRTRRERNKPGNKDWKFEIPKYTRPKYQRWAFYTVDPPPLVEWVAGLHPELLNSFNMTMSYRPDSDMTIHSGRLKRRTEPLTKDYGALFDAKTGMAVWLDTNDLPCTQCTMESRRREFMEKMKPVLDVHIYGWRADKSRMGCKVNADWENPDICLSSLGKEYKFFLAFENHFCPDYISDKYFNLFYKNKVDLIPVLRGALDHKKYLPRDTYIDAADFKSPEDLARYLVKVGNDKTMYTEMLRKKDRWVLAESDTVPCKMCEMVHVHRAHKGYHRNFLHSFYGGHQNPCRKPTDL